MKKCGACLELKPIDNYYKRIGSPDGLNNLCITCIKDRVKARYIEKMKDPIFLEKERLRGRIKQHKNCKGKPKHQPAPALKDLPMHIHKQSAFWYMNVRTGERIHRADLHKFLPLKPDPTVGEKRWDLNY